MVPSCNPEPPPLIDSSNEGIVEKVELEVKTGVTSKFLTVKVTDSMWLVFTQISAFHCKQQQDKYPEET